MWGHTLRPQMGPQPQVPWTFVRAPLQWSNHVILRWDYEAERGGIYVSRVVYERIQTEGPSDYQDDEKLTQTDHAFVRDWCITLERQAESDLRVLTLATTEVPWLDAGDVKDWVGYLNRSRGNKAMMEVAYTIMGLLNAHLSDDPHIEEMRLHFQIAVEGHLQAA